jgi:glycosyltransferase involved in cell wall biosynthesis
MALNLGQASFRASDTIGLSRIRTFGAQPADRNVARTILVFADWYLPGSKAGGPVSAIANLIDLVGDEFRFHVITRDRDLGEKCAYAGVRTNDWLSVGKARVLYTSDLSFANLRRRILEIDPDVMYLNSFFSPMTRRILLLRRVGLLRSSAVVLAPRGEFSPAALRIKRLRKWLYQQVAMRTSLYRDLVWQASSGFEEQQITAAGIADGAGDHGRLVLTPDVPSPHLLECAIEIQRPKKRPGAMRLIFLSRISRMKNLHFALKSLAAVHGNVEFEIVGPVEDDGYWAECREQIRALPGNIVVRSIGPVRHEDVNRTFPQHQFLLLPTRGENFGYAILEALAAGCPVLISDQTPWRDLRGVGAGWDLPLGRIDLWQNALQECVAMDDESYQRMSQGARSFAEKWCTSSFFQRDTANLFRSALRYVGAVGRNTTSNEIFLG